MIWDETHFWETTVLFSKSSFLGLDLVRDYNELNTPLPFIIFGALEHFSKDGLFAGRLLNLLLSLIITCAVGIPLGRKNKRSILAAVGLLSVPYYLWLSRHFYTDILAVFFVFAGFWLYLRNRHALSGMSFIFAIACRQYMLAFPLAIAVYEFSATLRGAFKSGSFRPDAEAIRRTSIRWIMPSIATLTILCWFWLFDGMAPKSGIAIPDTPLVQRQAFTLAVDASLYFLACVGLYFVIPEWILFSRRVNLQAVFTRRNTAIAIGLAVLFASFPPTATHGLLTKFASLLPVDFLGIALFCFLAVVACVRFCRLDLPFWIVLLNSGLMLKAHAWDKYVLPLVIVFWYLKSIEMLDRIPLASPARLEHRGASNVLSLPQSGYSLPNQSI